jgi:intracellular multiplication protein IcmG
VQPVTTQQPAAPAVVAQAPVIPAAPSVPAMPGMPNNQQVAVSAPQQMQPQQTQPYPAQMQPQQAMPAVVTVQSVPYQPASVMPAQAYPGQMPGSLPATYETAANGLNNQSNMAANQVQAEYVQKLNDFATQNKMLQNQVQTLNSRVSSLETELTQLTRILMRQYQSQNTSQSNPAAYPNNGAPVPAQMSSQQAEPKSLYNVQAIIPGRAWLRAENGETLTVAEGDQIKDLGRVSKIDPYDGVVEINTGTKVISLAYGNGG